MERRTLEHFTLEAFDERKFDHRFVSVVLHNDVDVFTKYTGDIEGIIENYFSERENAFNQLEVICYLNHPLGIVNAYLLKELPYLLYGFIPEMRGKHLASPFLSEYINTFFSEYREFCELYASIQRENKESIYHALDVGFTLQENSHTRYMISRENVKKIKIR